MANYRFKLNLPQATVIKLEYMPQVGETMELYGETYIIDKITPMKGNLYRMFIHKEVRTPIVIKKPTWFQIIKAKIGGKK